MQNEKTAKVVRADVNLGRRPYFLCDSNGAYVKDNNGIREIAYHTDDIVKNFPLLHCPKLTDITCELNLFLAHRYLGEFSVKKNQKKDDCYAESEAARLSSAGKKLDLETVVKLAKDLLLFLRWMEEQKDIDLQVLWSEPLNVDRQSCLDLHPLWQYRNHIYNIVDRKVLGEHLTYKVGCNYVNVVRHWYEWSRKNHRINRLPFKYVKRVINRPSTNKGADEMSNMLFGMSYPAGTKKGGIPVWTAKISLPITLTQKQTLPDDDLQPYSIQELARFLSSDVMKNSVTYQLFAKLAYICALRSFEVIKLNRSSIVNPAEDSRPFYRVMLIKGKGSKDRAYRIPPTLMIELWNYVNTPQYIERQVKFETKHSPDTELPVFINKSGERMVVGAVRNIISKVRSEQREKEQPVLARTFHDLKATSCTYLAVHLLSIGADENVLKIRLMAHAGHNGWETTKKYLNFAKSDEYNQPMDDWVNGIYEQVDKMMADINPNQGEL